MSYSDVYYGYQADVRRLTELKEKRKLTKKEKEELREAEAALRRMYPPGEGPSTNYGRGWNINNDYY